MKGGTLAERSHLPPTGGLLSLFSGWVAHSSKLRWLRAPATSRLGDDPTSFRVRAWEITRAAARFSIAVAEPGPRAGNYVPFLRRRAPRGSIADAFPLAAPLLATDRLHGRLLARQRPFAAGAGAVEATLSA